MNRPPALAGVVRDERLAKPLRLATVEVSDPNNQIVSTLSTDDNGAYEIKKLEEGVYFVRASAPLHENLEKKVKILKDATSTVDFSLNVGPELPTLPKAPQPPEIPQADTLPTYQTYQAPKPPQYPTYQRRHPSENYYEGGSSPYGYRSPYGEGIPEENGSLTQQQPTKTDLLAKAGAVLIQQMLAERKKKESQQPQ